MSGWTEGLEKITVSHPKSKIPFYQACGICIGSRGQCQLDHQNNVKRVQFPEQIATTA
jgi:hypothetical protein